MTTLKELTPDPKNRRRWLTVVEEGVLASS
jgi:hypothetical protein